MEAAKLLFASLVTGTALGTFAGMFFNYRETGKCFKPFFPTTPDTKLE